MIRNVLVEIGGIGIMGIVSLVLFFAVFTTMLIRVARMKKDQVEDARRLPLDDGIAAAGSEGTTP